MKITHLSAGSKFEFEGNEYTLAIKIDNTYNWKNSEGFFVLTQSCYFYGFLPTVEQVENMKKYLVLN